MKHITAWSYTDPGGRSVNEDYCDYQILPEEACFVLADGLGGHDKGEIASRLAGQYILDGFLSLSSITEEGLLSLLQGANEKVLEGQKNYPEMCTTVAAAFMNEDQFIWFHAGDSRMYYFKNGCLYCRSQDHSVPQLSVRMGELTPDQIRFHPDRNRLLKVLGEGKELGIGKLDDPIVPETGDAFLLCSDGFWEYVWETEMEADLLKSRTPDEWLSHMVKRILLKAPSEHDNFTGVAGFIGK